MKKLMAIGFLVLVNSFPVQPCELKMAYKDGAKGHLIGPPGNDEGTYLDLFSVAAEKIGCSLSVVRLPKGRLHERLRDGSVDFYPGTSFSSERSRYLHFFENGFMTGEVGVSRQDFPDISSLEQLKGHRLLAEIGTSKVQLEKFGVHLITTATLSFDQVTTMLRRQRADFYIADIEVLDTNLKSENSTSLREMGLKIHHDCCGGMVPMLVGFSIQSPHFQGERNSQFRQTQDVSPQNQRMTMAPGSVAARFSVALMALKEQGISQKIYNRDYRTRK